MPLSLNVPPEYRKSRSPESGRNFAWPEPKSNSARRTPLPRDWRSGTETSRRAWVNHAQGIQECLEQSSGYPDGFPLSAPSAQKCMKQYFFAASQTNARCNANDAPNCSIVLLRKENKLGINTTRSQNINL